MLTAALILLLVIVIFAVWEIWVCEGAHLGRRFVVWLYDLAAGRYDGIKQFNTLWERQFLGEPVAQVIGSLPEARLLDVGAGTGRLARSLGQLPEFHSTLICLEPSAAMLARGRARTPDAQTRWLRAWAVPLPFAAESFDFVSCLEVLEFTPSPQETLDELARVLRPGGWLLITNRVGREAPWILGRTTPRSAFPDQLQAHGFASVDVFPWQVDYDLAWARKRFAA